MLETIGFLVFLTVTALFIIDLDEKSYLYFNPFSSEEE